MWMLPAVLLLHISYLIGGAMLLRGCVGAWPTIRNPARVIGSYANGLVINTVTVFAINQFAHFAISMGLLWGVSIGVCTIGCIATMRCAARGSETAPTKPWSAEQLVLLLMVVTVFAIRHTEMLWAPLEDWDTYFYHLMLARQISEGHFPGDIGPSVMLHIESAYPPLLYFIYGLAQFVETPDVTTAAPKITGVIVNAALCVMCYGLCRDRFRLTRVAALGGAMSCAIVINVIPNMQSLMNVFLLLAIYESWDLLTPRAQVSRGQCVLCGIAWAGAYWANYTGFIIAGLFAVGVAAWLVYARIDRRMRPLAFRPLVIAATVGAVLVSVHMIRNWLVAGNPIYPAMFGVIGGRGVSPWYLEHFTYTKTIDPRWHEIYVSYLLSMPQSTLLVAGAALALLMHRPSISTAWRAVFVVMFAGYYVVWVTLLQVFTAAIFRYPYALVGPASAIVVAQLQSAARRTTWARLLGVVAMIAITAASLPKLSIGSALTPDTIAIIKARAIGFYVVLGFIVVAGALSRARWAKVDRRFNRRWVGALVGVVLVSFLVLTEWRRDLVNGGSLRGQTTPIHYAVISVWLAVLCVVFFLQRDTSRLPARWATVMAIVFFCCTLMVGFQPRQFNQAKLPVDTDIAWINRFVPAGSVLLTLETRLYFLEHGFFPADHHELEPFYRAQDARTARDELKKLGVTHIYYNSNTTTSDLFNTQIRLLMSGEKALPGTDGGMIDVIYSKNKTDWVAVLR